MTLNGEVDVGDYDGRSKEIFRQGAAIGMQKVRRCLMDCRDDSKLIGSHLLGLWIWTNFPHIIYLSGWPWAHYAPIFPILQWSNPSLSSL